MSEAEILDRLRPRFLTRAADLHDMLRLRAAGQASSDPELRLAIHKLIGAAGLFGFHDLGAAAFAAETRWLESGEFDAADLDVLAARLQAVPEA
jgi:hypothetical protein